MRIYLYGNYKRCKDIKIVNWWFFTAAAIKNNSFLIR